MADKEFVVKNGLVVNSTIVANSTQIAFSTINSTSNGFFVNSTAIVIGNSSVNTTINSTAFSGLVDNTLKLGGISATNYLQTSATAADSDKLGGVAAASYLTNSSSYTISGVHTHTANIVLTQPVGISANSTYGIANQVLTSNGSAVYWKNAPLLANVNGGTGALQYYNGSILGSSAGLLYTVSSNTITIGNTGVFATINSTSYTGSANSATYFGGQLATVYTNSSTLSTTLSNYVTSTSLSTTLLDYLTTTGTAADSNKLGGTLAANYVTNTGTFTLGGAITFNNQAILNGAVTIANSITANANIGSAGQVLTSGGSGKNVYWTTAVNLAAQYAWTNTQSFSNTISFNGTIVSTNSISANGGVGAAGLVLTSGGALNNVYWGSVPAANVNGGTGGIQYYNGINMGSAAGLTWAAGSNSVFVSNNIVLGIGTATATINSTSYSGTSANATNLNGLAASAYVKGTDTFFIGCTSISHTRTTGALALTGVSIDGNAGNITGTYSGTLTSSQITTALTYTPYNSTNPAGYTTNLGTVTQVTVAAGTPATIATGTTTPVITIALANASTNGYLSSTDWTTFNSKGPGTVTQVSAAAGTPLSVSSGTSTPVVSIALANASTNGYLSSSDWSRFNTGAGGTVTQVSAAAGTPVSIATGTTTPVITIPQSTSSVNGYLSSSDWTTFNSKASTSSPTFTGTPIAPTAAVDNNTTQIATTAYVVGQGYLKSSTAASTYQTQSAMTSYLTTSSAASTYQTQSGMSSYLTSTAASAAYAPLSSPSLSNPSFTGLTKVNGYYTSNVVSLSGFSITLTPTSGNYFAVTGAGGAVTITFGTAPASGNLYSMVVKTSGATSITWPAGIKWPGAVAPTMTSSGTDIWVFFTDNGGTLWRGNLVQKDSR